MGDPDRHLGPLRDGGTVAVVGGGPGGASCAISLLKESQRLGRKVRVIVFEPKTFGTHYNQCLGVLSPPLLQLLDEWFGITLPQEMLQRRIAGYVLHCGGEEIELRENSGKGATWAARRVEFDRFLLEKAQEFGAEVVKSRVTNLEFHPEDVVVYHEAGSISADVMVGAFGLDSTLRSVLRKTTRYRPPRYLGAVVTKLHPADPLSIEAFRGMIHVYLPAIPGIEFAALVPKGNHVSIITAGSRVSIKVLKKFLRLPEVSAMLPFTYEVTHVFKGEFPNGPGKGIYGDRYVLIGDSAGLIRPFKGKGVNSAVITGRIAAETILTSGISGRAFRGFEEQCRFLTQDLWYGRFVRHFVVFSSNHLSLRPILEIARQDDVLKKALYDSVSGDDTYRSIVRSCLNPRTLSSIALRYAREALLPSRG